MVSGIDLLCSVHDIKAYIQQYKVVMVFLNPIPGRGLRDIPSLVAIQEAVCQPAINSVLKLPHTGPGMRVAGL